MGKYDDEHQMIKDCEARESKLDDWERGFIDSIGNQLAEKEFLTTKQCDKLGEIWERITRDG